MNSKFIAIIGFFVFFQIIEIVSGQQPCVVEYQNAINSCYWGSRNQADCVAAKDYIVKQMGCTSTTGVDCSFTVGGCGDGKLGVFKQSCTNIAGENVEYRKYPLTGKCASKDGSNDFVYKNCC